jgi:hypothetical protein
MRLLCVPGLFGGMCAEASRGDDPLIVPTLTAHLYRDVRETFDRVYV